MGLRIQPVRTRESHPFYDPYGWDVADGNHYRRLPLLDGQFAWPQS